jgi:uncharacterized protein YndB with AHSA1/START domain
MPEYCFRLTRVFEAPREQVWREWTDPAAFADWFGGPDVEVPLDSVALDVRPGGALRATMVPGAPHEAIRWRGEYREVHEPELLVFTITDGADDDRFELVTVVLSDLGDGRTEMRFEQRGQGRPEDFERAEQGWGGFFDRLAERLTS